MSEQTKKALLLVVVIVALVVAVWSGVNSFGNRENVVGDLGDLSAGKGKAGEDLPAQAPANNAQPLGVGKAGELQGGSSASGAPPGMGGEGK